MRNSNLFSMIMKKLKNKKDDEMENMDHVMEDIDEEKEDEDYLEKTTTTGAQLDNGMRPMRSLKKAMELQEENERPEEEENESDEYQALEDAMGTEKHSAGKKLFPKGNALRIMIAVAKGKKEMK